MIRRRLLNFASAVSLLLCVLSVSAWSLQRRLGWPTVHVRLSSSVDAVSWNGRIGFSVKAKVEDAMDQNYSVSLRHLFFPSAILPLIWAFATARRSGHSKNGSCHTCGYNLTGNASGVCPECGTPVQSKPEAIV